MNKKRILSIVSALIVVLSAVGFGAYRYDRNRRLPYAEKNSYAMGTIVSQKVSGEFAAKQIEKSLLLINYLENNISRNVETSSVSTLNSDGAVSDKETAQIIEKCNRLSEETKGAFDITVGGAVDLWDFGGENEGIPDEKELKRALSQVGYDKLKVSGDKISLSSKASVDLGAVGKGLACDMVISLYKADAELDGAIVAVGGSIGCYGKYNKAGDSWRIGIRHPRKENAFIGVLKLKEGFVSTSGDYEKYFEKDGVRYHHILDARTGMPASSDIISATVVCNNGLLSDALSTACFILGSDEGARLVEKYNASAVFVRNDMEIITVGEVDFEKQ